jgi:integrase/recombinase XerD
MLTVYRRHLRECDFFGKPRNQRGSRNCRMRCPLWVQGSLGGEYIRKALKLNAWEAASDLVRSWESSGQIGVVRAEIPTLKEAVQKFVADGEARNLNAESLKKMRDAVERLFLGFCTKQGYRLLKQLGVDEVREFRNSLMKKYAASSAQTRLEYVRGFLRFCHGSGWISSNPALSVKPPKSDSSPTLPFEEAQIVKMLKAANTFTTNGNFRAGNRKRVRAMVLLLRYSGLRISDASTLERSRLNGTKLFIYTQKTGTPVWVPLPQRVVDAVNESPSDDPKYFFWNGRCLRTSAVKIWETTFKTVFEKADIQDGHIHRFRDTFAVRLLEKGVSIETVSVLLGHSNIGITLKHYRPWVKSLQEKLEREVARAWAS